MSFVVNALSSVVEWVGDAVESVAEFIVEDIISPVLEFTGDFIEGFFEDPLAAIAKIAAIATGQTWAIPLIDGAKVAADGGDLGDVLKATATSYVTQQAGQAFGEYAAGTETFGDVTSGFSDVTNDLIQEAISQEAANVSQNIIYGEDPFENFGYGALTIGMGELTSRAMGYLDEKFEAFSFETEKTDAQGNVVLEADGVTPVMEMKNTPQAVQNIISASLTAELTGQEVTPELLSGAITKAYITTNTVNGFIDPFFDQCFC